MHDSISPEKNEADNTLVYCLRGHSACPVHKLTHKAWEADINRELAFLTSTGETFLREAIILAIWGADSPTLCPSRDCKATQLIVQASGNDADWLLRCRGCGLVAARAEHKPRGAPAHWSRASLAMYRTPAILGPHEWLNSVHPDCESPHAVGSCAGGHISVELKNDLIVLAAPQVLRYSRQDDGSSMPVTIITDVHKDANALYGTASFTHFTLRLNEQFFPIRTTTQLLDDLAALLERTEIVSR